LSFRARFVGAISVVILITLAIAFMVVGQLVNASQERQFDDALRREALQEASEIAESGGRQLRFHPRLDPDPDDIGPLTTYAALYDVDGQVLDTTSAWKGAPPELSTMTSELDDLQINGHHFRAMLLEIPGHPDTMLLLAGSREALDKDEAFLARVMAFVFGVAFLLTVILTSAVVRRLTQVHSRIAEVARGVSAQDLSARVGAVKAAPEIVQLARDVDEMIERIDVLLRNQTDFITHAAHELRSPLTTLYGELSHALRRSRDVEQYREAIDEALLATRRLLTLADDLLALTRVGRMVASDERDVDLVEVVQEAWATVASEAAGRGVRLELDLAAMYVRGNPLDLTRLARNLLENAVGHAPPDTVVEVEGQRDGDVAVLRVRDYGTGIGQGDAERVFQPFIRGSRERASTRPGTGLGLAIVREIAKQHRGSVELRAVEGPGACFIVRLPLADTSTD
jgi:signal transduction histidine kinase